MMNMFLMVMGVVGIIFVLFVLFSLMAQALAKHNLFFTFNKEGESKAVIHNGAFDRAIMKYEGFRFDDRWNVIPSRRREQFKTKEEAVAKGYYWDGTKRRRGDKWWRKFCAYFMGGGLEFIGLWPFYRVFRYDFRWGGLKEGKPIPHDKNLDYVFVKSAVYYAKLEGVETSGMVPLDIGLNLTIRVTNPYRAIFRTHQWLEFTVSRITPYIRQYIPAENKEFKELVGANQGPDSELFKFLGKSNERFTVEDKKRLKNEGRSDKDIENMELAGKGILWVLWEIYGVDIQSIEFASIATVGKEYETAAAKKWSAERDEERIAIEARAEAKKIDTLAEAEARKIDTLAKAEAEKIRKISLAIKESGEIGLASKAMDTIKEASTKAGNWVIPSNLLDFLKIGGQGSREKEKEGGDKK